MKNKEILITGGAGFTGKHLVEALSKNNRVTVLDIKKSNFPNSIIVDIRKRNWFKKIGKIDYIFHLAAIVGVDYVAAHPIETINTEILGMINVVDFAIRNNVKKIIYSSTSSVHDLIKKQSLTSYSIAKYIAEIYLREIGKKHNIDYSIARLFNIYGKYQTPKMVVRRFIDQALKNKSIIVFNNGNQTRDLTFINDAVKALILIAESTKTNSEIIDIGTGIETEIIDLAKKIKTITNSKSKIVFKKTPEARKDFEIKKRKADVKKLKRLTGFICKTPLDKGLNMLVKNME